MAQTQTTPVDVKKGFVRTPGWYLRRIGWVVLLLLGLAITWFLLLKRDPPPSETSDLLTHAIEHARTFSPAQATSNARVAEGFLLNRFGWPIDIPELEGFQLSGVGSVAFVPGVELPALRYDDAGGRPVVVYAYDYVFLDQVAEKLALPRAVYLQLGASPPIDNRRVRGIPVVNWRNRGVIFTAVLEDAETAEAFVEGLRNTSG